MTDRTPSIPPSTPESHRVGACPNCGADAAAEYCSRCGQPQGDLLPTVGAWLSEVVDELLLVEARLPRTLAALVWPPGRLTAEWLRGRRASRVSPLRLYLVAAVPFFLALSLATPRGLAELLEVVVASMPVVYEDGDFLAPQGPLVFDGEADPDARAAWQAEFLRRSAHNDSVARALEQRVETGLGRVYDTLPLVVGLLMVPTTAAFVRLGSAGRLRFVGAMILSLHTHALGYLAALIAWPLGLAGLAGGIGAVAYVAGARRAVLGEWLPRSIAFGSVALLFYALAFLGVYILLVLAMATFWPDWAYGIA